MTSNLFGFVRICSSLFKCNYVKNQNLFLNFLFCLCNVHQILNISKKKMIVIGNVFPILQTVKGLVRSVPKIHHFRTSFDSQHVKGSQTLVKSAREHFYQIFSSLWWEMILKICPLMKYEFSEVFVNTLTVMTSILFGNAKIFCVLFKRNYLKNKKVFLTFLFHFWNLQKMLNIFKKRKIVIANVYPKL